MEGKNHWLEVIRGAEYVWCLVRLLQSQRSKGYHEWHARSCLGPITPGPRVLGSEQELDLKPLGD
jgi:hypothetical protein